MSNIRLLLVAQSPVLRYGIRIILEEVATLEHVAEANDALQAGAVAARFDPDMIVIQYALPGVSGALAARLLRERRPRAKIVILSDYTAEADVLHALQNGADALLSLALEPASFQTTVRDLLAGRGALGDVVLERPALAARMLDAVRAEGLADIVLGDAPRPNPSALTAAEIGLLDGLVRDAPQAEIARQLGEPESALRPITASLYAKLAAIDRTTAIIAAVRHGLVHLGDHLPPQPATHGSGADIAPAA